MLFKVLHCIKQYLIQVVEKNSLTGARLQRVSMSSAFARLTRLAEQYLFLLHTGWHWNTYNALLRRRFQLQLDCYECNLMELLWKAGQ